MSIENTPTYYDESTPVLSTCDFITEEKASGCSWRESASNATDLTEKLTRTWQGSIRLVQEVSGNPVVNTAVLGTARNIAYCTDAAIHTINLADQGTTYFVKKDDATGEILFLETAKKVSGVSASLLTPVALVATAASAPFSGPLLTVVASLALASSALKVTNETKKLVSDYVYHRETPKGSWVKLSESVVEGGIKLAVGPFGSLATNASAKATGQLITGIIGIRNGLQKV